MQLFKKSEQDHIYKLRLPDYRENRDDMWLLVWKDIPHWIVIDSELYNLLNELGGKRSLDKIIDLHPELVSKKNEIFKIITALIKSKVID
mgnify:CR=1 FL=1